MEWDIGRQCRLATGVGFNHYSNGNTLYPNMGLNIMEARLGVSRSFYASGKRERQSLPDMADIVVLPHVSCDVIVYGATRIKGIAEESYLVPGSFAVAGMNVNPMYNFNKYWKAGVSVDCQYDESANLQDHIAFKSDDGNILFYRPPLNEQISVGASVRCEFVMPVFSINIGIGRTFIYRGDDLNSLYQLAVLKTNISRNLFLHIGYKFSEFRTPRNLMLGIGFRIHNKRP